MRNQVQLITYADRLAGDLPGLRSLLTGRLAGLFGGVHVLPFFRPFDGADAGFDPADHREVDPRLGTWDDVAALARAGLDPVVDLIVNHVSADSPEFRDVLVSGDASPYAPLFLTFGSVFPEGATEEELLTLYRPRPGLRSRRCGWAGAAGWSGRRSRRSRSISTCGHPRGAPTWPRSSSCWRGTGSRSCGWTPSATRSRRRARPAFMTPETFAFIGELAAQAGALALGVLVEVHSYFLRQIEIARQVDRVYDFALSPLVLHALHTGDAGPLLRWLDVRPANCVTVLDTHDGIGVVDVGADPDDPGPGPADPAADPRPRRGDPRRQRRHEPAGDGTAAGNLDIYQVNCTFYDALGRDDRRYLLARLVQFFTPGVPQVYYVGLLAGTNDVDLLRRSGVGRDVNRHHYTPEEIDGALQQPVVRDLLAAIRFRNRHPAFGGTFRHDAGDAPGTLRFSWANAGARARLDVDAGTSDWSVTATDGRGSEVTVRDGAALETLL